MYLIIILINNFYAVIILLIVSAKIKTTEASVATEFYLFQKNYTMENSAHDDNNSEEFLQWYIDMIENYPNTFIHYLSDDALLQWFGRSIRGPERILYFIKTNMQGTKHIIGIQNTANSSENTTMVNNILPTENSTSKSCADSTQTELNVTPETNISKVNFDLVEIDELACGDGPNIGNLLLKRKTENGEGDCSYKTRYRTTNIFETDGVIEFCRPCYKRGVAETKWERSCNLKVGYVGTLANPIDFNIQFIIYSDNMPCKRNLLPEFDMCVTEN